MVAVATEKKIKILIQSTLGIINLKVQTFLCPIMYNILASSDKINIFQIFGKHSTGNNCCQ